MLTIIKLIKHHVGIDNLERRGDREKP